MSFSARGVFDNATSQRTVLRSCSTLNLTDRSFLWARAEGPQSLVAGVELGAMKIAIGADHAGYELKEKIKQRLAQEGNEVHDKGTDSTDSVDYPDFARLVGEEVARKDADFGVLICGSGIGMSIAANKVPGVRAAHVTSMYEAQMAREHNDANVVTVGARVLDERTALQAVEKFLHTPFAGGRHQRRVQKIMEIEHQEQAHHA